MNVKQRKSTSMLAILAALAVGGIAALIALVSVGFSGITASSQDEMNRRIYLSPSVQYDNRYAVGDTNEGEQMQLLADLVEDLLTEQGFEVLRNDPDGSLEDAVALSNANEIGLHLALHTNAADGSTVRGCEAFIKRGSGKLSKEIAELLVDEITDLGTKSRGVKKTNSLYETNTAEADAVVLLEVDFHDNEEGAAWLLGNRSAIAEAIAQAVLTYYGEEPNE